QRRAYDHYQELATGGGNDGVIPGIKSPWGYGVAVKGPAVDLIHGYVYWMSCERSALPGVCSEHALKRVPISVLETAAKMPDPVDASSKAPTGDAQDSSGPAAAEASAGLSPEGVQAVARPLMVQRLLRLQVLGNVQGAPAAAPTEGARGWNSNWSWQQTPKPDYSDPPSWPGWSHRRYWVQAIRRWNKATDLPLARRAEKVLRCLGWELQPDFEHIPETVLESSAYLDAILAVLDMKAGVREDDEKREAFRSLFYQSQRRRDETLAQYAMRKQQDFTKASAFGISVPSSFQAMLLREGASLSDQNQQNLTALLQGRDDDPQMVARCLGRMDVRTDRLHAYVDGDSIEESGDFTAYGDDGPDENADDELEDAAVLAELDNLDLSEDQVNEVFAVIDPAEEEEVLIVDTIINGPPDIAGPVDNEKGAPTAFCYAPGPCQGSSGSGFSFLSRGELQEAAALAKERLGPSSGCWSFLTLRAGEAILDIGATQDLIGSGAMLQMTQELKRCGLRPVPVDVPISSPSGIGGSAKAVKAMLVPISPGGVPGVLQMTVLEENIPPLLSVGFLEFLKTCIDLEEDPVSFRRLGVTMPLTKQPSGHRTIPLVQWKGDEFPVPEEILRKYKIEARDFQCSSSAYITGSDASEGVEVRLSEKTVHADSCDERAVVFRASSSVPPQHSKQEVLLPGGVVGSEVRELAPIFMPPRDPERSPRLWRVLVQRVLFVVEAARVSYMRLVLSERAKSVKSERRKYLEMPAQAPASCLHPVDRHLRRGNQYGSWKVCGVCGARLEYHKRAKAKAKGKSKQTSAPMPPPTMPEPKVEPLSRAMGSEGYRPNRSVAPNPVENETMTVLQTMLQSFQDQSRMVAQAMGSISKSLEDISRGQGQLLLMAQDNLEKPMSVDQISLIANQAAVTAMDQEDDSDLDDPKIELALMDDDHLDDGDFGAVLGSVLSGVPAVFTDHKILVRTVLIPRLMEETVGPDGAILIVIFQPSLGHSLRVFANRTITRPMILIPRQMEEIVGPDGAILLVIFQPSLGFDSKGNVLYSGPSEPDAVVSSLEDGTPMQVWVLPRELELMRRAMSSDADPVRLGEDGVPCEHGEFWVFKEDSTLNEMDVAEETDVEIGIAKKDSLATLAAGRLRSMAREQEWERRGHISSLVVLGLGQDLLDELQAQGVRVPPVHEQFRESAGWDVRRKEHRGRFRSHLAKRQPRLLMMQPQGCEENSLHHELSCGFCLQAAEHQEARGETYVLLAPSSSSLWTSRGVQSRLKASQASVVHFGPALRDGQSWKIMSNHPNFANVSGEFYASRQDEHRDSLTSSSSSRLESELCARGLLIKADFRDDSCLGLLKLALEKEGASKRAVASRAGRGRNLVLGGYVHGGVLGITRECRERPWLTKYLSEFLRSKGDREPHTTLSVSLNTKFEMHADSHNRSESVNVSYGLGDYEDGGIWVHQPPVEPSEPAAWRRGEGGRRLRGKVLPTRGRLIQFSPKVLHKTEPWMGQRWIITGYSIRGEEKIDPRQRRELQRLGFRPRGQRLPSELKKQLSWATGCLLSGIKYQPQESGACFFGEDEPENEEEEDLPLSPSSKEAETEPKAATESQKRLIRKLHVNLGHPHRDRFLHMLRAAGAHEHVLSYVKNSLECEVCDVKHRQDNRRRAQYPKTFSFNRVLCVDVLYLKFRDLNVPILNMTCAGTHYQVVQRLPVAPGTSGGTPTAEAAWRGFATTWLRFLGAPSLMITDSGNEFKGIFERQCESHAILQHVTIPEQPWKNAFAERHGGWVKDKLDKEIASGQCAFQTLEELDEFLSALTATKNRWLQRSGYTPAALVFGELPRVPGELLADDEISEQAVADAYSDPSGLDQAATEFRRKLEIREKARQAAMAQTSREAFQKAARASTHQARRWVAGQWVYVFRRGRPNNVLHPRDRWCGPGVIVLVSQKGIYVAMRSRLWRCGPEQLRPAHPNEMLGAQMAEDPGLAELLRKINSGVRAGITDVSNERPPLPPEEFAPVVRDQEGVPLGGEEVSRPSEAPQPVEAVPERLLPRPAPGVQSDEGRIVPPPGLPPPPQRDWRDQEPGPQDSATGSRRSSMEEPAAELEPPAEALHRPLERILEESSDEEVLGPVNKAARLSSEDEVVGSRAPGTPVGRLLQAIPRLPQGSSSSTAGQAPASVTPSSLTPGEEVTGSGRVERQVAEFEGLRSHRERSPRRSVGDPSEAQSRSESSFTYCASSRGWNLLAKRGDEISLKALANEERKLFEQSDKVEWEAMLATGAVRVLTGKEAQEARQKFPDRILSSRMVRRKKPLPDKLNAWKAKSRWCVQGHSDPDTSELQTYAPTPSTEGLMMFLQTATNLRQDCAFADVRNAFCQSLPLSRSKGPLFAEGCEGLNLPPGALIALDVPVYGLDDAPAAWRRTVTDFLLSIGFVRHITEPCWYLRFDEKHRNEAQVLVEVDDLIVATNPSLTASIKETFQARFHFGEWDYHEAEYAGRKVVMGSDYSTVSQEKYILEQVFPIQIAKGRRQLKEDKLNEEEFGLFRSLIYKVNWLARESRPEAAGLASIMASRLPHAQLKDILILNKYVNHLRSTASRAIKIWRFKPEEMVFISVSDAGGVTVREGETDEEGLPTDATQGAWAVFTAEGHPVGAQQVRATPVAWRSSKLKRKVFSTFGGETQAMLQGVNEVEWLQIMYRDAIFNDIRLDQWRNSLSPHLVIMKSSAHLPARQPQISDDPLRSNGAMEVFLRRSHKASVERLSREYQENLVLLV
ncbi:RE1, partial [Symbiodinium necroappetens]